MKINNFVNQKEILKYFQLDTLDSRYVTDATYWRSKEKLGWIVEIDGEHYGNCVDLDKNQNTPEHNHLHYQVIELNFKETLEKICNTIKI